MQFENTLMPDHDQLEGLLEETDGAPIYMVNLLKFRERAEYPDGSDSHLTGREAFLRYVEGIDKCLEKVGGHVAFSGEVRRMWIGSVEELWDDVAIAMYPSRTALLEMMQLPEMDEIGVHRTAGLAGQLSIETVMPPESDG